jgi:hypothetical protein
MTRAVGPDHAITLATRDDVAHWRGETGRTVGASRDYARLVADMTRVFGPDHPDTRTARNNVEWLRRTTARRTAVP